MPSKFHSIKVNELEYTAPHTLYLGIRNILSNIFTKTEKIIIFLNIFSLLVICIIKPTEPDKTLINWAKHNMCSALL